MPLPVPVHNSPHHAGTGPVLPVYDRDGPGEQGEKGNARAESLPDPPGDAARPGCGRTTDPGAGTSAPGEPVP
ncbi:hypothetical protein Shyhy01_02100 [Streptomyces hygroscopicus subsp. hygroscopicus]|nr:hypothetical protein Shyhy01_02100 [Streptomyces hygroscopicus subsp. hygroscopicus]